MICSATMARMAERAWLSGGVGLEGEQLGALVRIFEVDAGGRPKRNSALAGSKTDTVGRGAVVGVEELASSGGRRNGRVRWLPVRG
jgi:hypothetical protein